MKYKTSNNRIFRGGDFLCHYLVQALLRKSIGLLFFFDFIDSANPAKIKTDEEIGKAGRSAEKNENLSPLFGAGTFEETRKSFFFPLIFCKSCGKHFRRGNKKGRGGVRKKNKNLQIFISADATQICP